LKQLSDILKNTTNNPTARTQAGNVVKNKKIFSICYSFLSALQLKNALYSRDDIKAFQERWLRIPEDSRSHVKNNVSL
jgi:hypothetical protein